MRLLVAVKSSLPKMHGRLARPLIRSRGVSRAILAIQSPAIQSYELAQLICQEQATRQACCASCLLLDTSLDTSYPSLDTSCQSSPSFFCKGDGADGASAAACAEAAQRAAAAAAEHAEDMDVLEKHTKHARPTERRASRGAPHTPPHAEQVCGSTPSYPPSQQELLLQEEVLLRQRRRSCTYKEADVEDLLIGPIHSSSDSEKSESDKHERAIESLLQVLKYASSGLLVKRQGLGA